MWGLIIGGCIAAIAVGLRVGGSIGDKGLATLVTFALASGVAIAYFGRTREVDVGPLKLKTFQDEADKFTKEKLAEIDNKFRVQSEAVSSLIDKADKTREALEKVAEEAAPPTLSLARDPEATKTADGGFQVKLGFTPSKNVAFGTVVFLAEVLEGDDAIIRQLGATMLCFNATPTRSEDDKSARIMYVPSSPHGQRLILNGSAPCKLRLSGTHLAEPLELEVM